MNLISKHTKSVGAKILFNLLGILGYNGIKEYQKDNGLVVDGLFGQNTFNNLYHKLLNVKLVDFDGGYFKQRYTKKQIIWHHSAGWDNARGMFSWWLRDGRTHVATAIGITDDGTVYRGFDESYWAASIGCKAKVFKSNDIDYIWNRSSSGNWYIANNRLLDKAAVAVEICNGGYLEKRGDKYYTWFDHEISKERVSFIDYKGYKYFEKYTEKELETLKWWTALMAIRFDIPLYYNENDMWSVSKKALSGERGLFTHNSYRFDKTDVSPQPELIQVAKDLSCLMW